ncbi:hypothetical protein B0J18DRAFT_188966 [Chaetomium sp. MPI-SDFR-AT-0129]|nr:hypothetical protein B0J18DRAFT_188966 [Chaetomium sp. MPI-SDFR-AT-0129]
MLRSLNSLNVVLAYFETGLRLLYILIIMLLAYPIYPVTITGMLIVLCSVAAQMWRFVVCEPRRAPIHDVVRFQGKERMVQPAQGVSRKEPPRLPSHVCRASRCDWLRSPTASLRQCFVLSSGLLAAARPDTLFFVKHSDYMYRTPRPDGSSQAILSAGRYKTHPR